MPAGVAPGLRRPSPVFRAEGTCGTAAELAFPSAAALSARNSCLSSSLHLPPATPVSRTGPIAIRSSFLTFAPAPANIFAMFPVRPSRSVMWITVRPGYAFDEAALIDHAHTALAGYKCPKRVYLLPALPRTPLGKLQRAALRPPPVT